MKLRTLVITVGALALASIVAFFLNRPSAPPAPDARIGQSLVDSSAVEQATQFRLAEGDRHVLLQRQDDGTWRVANYHELPADFSKLSRFIGDLQAAKIDRLVSTNPERIARLEFKDTVATLLGPGDRELWTVSFGRTAESGGRFVQFGNEPKAYLARFNGWIDVEAKNWADATLVSIRPEEVTRVEIGFEGAPPVVATRARAEDPFAAESAPEGQRLRAERIASLLSTLGSLRFSDTTAPDNADAVIARRKARELKLTTFAGQTLTIALGRKPEEKVLKAPSPTDGQSGPAAALGSIADLAKSNEAQKKAGESESKPLEPTTETIPAGPVFAFVSSSSPQAPIDALMKKRAFQIADYTFTSLPQKPEDLFESAPADTPSATTEAPSPAVP